VMMLNLTEWKEAFVDYLTALQKEDGKKASAYIVKSPSITLTNGKSVSLDNVADVFRSAADKIDTEQELKYATLELTGLIANAAQEAKVDDIVNRAKAYNALCAELSDVVQQLGDYISNYPRGSEELTFVTDGAYKLASAFAGVVQAQHKAFGEIASWCLNASLSVSYGATLAYSVAKFAWKSINQCKDTLQMPEEDFAQLQAMLLNLQDTVTTNAA
jgi:CRISPR/Cas system CMR-associated protein Cmr5 small subunit